MIRSASEAGQASDACADMVELADTPDLGSGAERCAGSSPVTRTIKKRYCPGKPRFYRGFRRFRQIEIKIYLLFLFSEPIVYGRTASKRSALFYFDGEEHGSAAKYIILDNRNKIEDMLEIEQLPDLGDMAEYAENHSGIGKNLIYAVWGLEEILGEIYGKIDCYDRRIK